MPANCHIPKIDRVISVQQCCKKCHFIRTNTDRKWAAIIKGAAITSMVTIANANRVLRASIPINKSGNQTTELVGRSWAGDCTSFVVPSLGLALDAGYVVHSKRMDSVFITHCHTDHCHHMTHLKSLTKPLPGECRKNETCPLAWLAATRCIASWYYLCIIDTLFTSLVCAGCFWLLPKRGTPQCNTMDSIEWYMFVLPASRRRSCCWWGVEPLLDRVWIKLNLAEGRGTWMSRGILQLGLLLWYL